MGIEFASGSFDKLFSAQFEDVLNALETNDYIKIVSEPKVVVANGKTTSMNVGDTVSVKTSSYATDTSSTGTVRNTYIQKDLGLTIKVTPFIQKNGLIVLNTSFTHETLKKETSDGLISTAKKSINSDFNLMDGGSIAIGGLTASQDIKALSKIPVLGDIPILDYLFSYETTKTVRSTLTIFIQVKVIK